MNATRRQEAVTSGLALCLEGVKDLESWREDFRRIFQILTRECGPSMASDAAATKVFEAVEQATDGLREFRAARLRQLSLAEPATERELTFTEALLSVSCTRDDLIAAREMLTHDFEVLRQSRGNFLADVAGQKTLRHLEAALEEMRHAELLYFGEE